MVQKEKSSMEKKGGLSLSGLSAKDKKMLGIVLFLAIAAGSYVGLSDLFQKNQQLREEYETIQSELDEKTTRAARKKTLLSDLETLNTETLTIANQYYGTVNQGEFIFQIDDFINRSGIELKKVSFAETTELEFPEEETTSTGTTASSSSDAGSTSETQTSSSSSDASSTTNASSDTDATASDATTSSSSTTTTSSTTDAATQYADTNITQMTARIEFEGTYTDVIKLLELVDENDKTIVSSELKLTRPNEVASTQVDNPTLSGEILLRFYQVKDVERYVAPAVSKIDQTPIPVAANTSPFKVPEWLVISSSTDSSSSSSNSSGTTGTSATDSSSNLSPSYLEQLGSSGTNNLSAYLNSTTVYKFESALQLVQTGNGASTTVSVDNADFQEGAGSNVVNLPASSGEVYYEMAFSGPEVSLNSQPTNISFALSASKAWGGEVGLLLENASGQKINVQLDMSIDWTGWREVTFSPGSITNATYPLKIKGFYFKTPSGSSSATTLKLDNLAVHNLVTN